MWLNISIFVEILGSSIAQVEVLIFGEGQWSQICDPGIDLQCEAACKISAFYRNFSN